MGILTGIRVLDLATYIAAPAAATILSDFGAEVIKVERPPYGDPYRYLSLVPGMPVSEEHYCWVLDGRNKKSIALNLADPGARVVVERLIQWCDVLITNFQPSQLEKFRLRYQDIENLNERLIYASVTGYGESGEDAEKPGFDMTAYWARSGLMATIHNAGADPAPSPAGFGDHPTAMTLFSAIMLALYRRERTGRGGRVSTSLLANGAWSNSCNLQAALLGAEWPPRRTRESPANPLVNHYLTRDGKRFMFCMLEPERDWKRVCSVFGWPHHLEDARFCSPAARRENAQELVRMIDYEIARKDMAEWAALFLQYEIVWGIIPTTQETAVDSQMDAAGVLVSFRDSQWKTVTNPIRIEGDHQDTPRLGSAVGQDTTEVLELLGFDAFSREQLLAKGAALQKDI